MADAPHVYDPDAPVEDEPRPVTRALLGYTVRPTPVAGATANVGTYGIQCACMQEITLEHLRRGYHPPCMRDVTIVLGEAP